MAWCWRLFGRAALAEDANVADSKPGFSGVALAHNVAQRARGRRPCSREAVAAGGRLIKPAHKVFWGGYTGCFADPDGHLWEVAYNPGFPLDARGRICRRLPRPNRMTHDRYTDHYIAGILGERARPSPWSAPAPSPTGRATSP